LFGPVRRAATMEALVNSFIKLEHFPVRDTYSKNINSHGMDWTNLKINLLMELAMRFQYREHQKFISTTSIVGKSSRRPTHSSSNTKMFCSHISIKTIKSGICKAINSFSLQEAVVGVSEEEILFAVKETSNVKTIWNKEKRSSKKDKVGIQKSSSESDMEIEVENDDSGDDVSD